MRGRGSASEKTTKAMSAEKEGKEENLLECSPADKKKKKKSRKTQKSVGSSGNATSIAPDEEANPNDPSLSSIGKLTSEKEVENNEETLESRLPSKKKKNKKRKKRKKTESMSSASPEPPCSGDDDDSLKGCAKLQTDDKRVSEAEMSTGAVVEVTPQPEIKKGRDKENSDVSNKPHETDEVPSAEKEGSDVMDSAKETYKESCKNGSNPSLAENTEMTKARKEDLCMSGEDENENVDVASFDRNRDTAVAFPTQPTVEDLESDAEDNSSSMLGCEG